MSAALAAVTGWGAEAAGWAVLVHGGAGGALGAAAHLHVAGASRAATVAAEVLRGGGSCLDAVERAVTALEDDPAFNAGTGGCLNEDGLIELDASIMAGQDLRAGAVCVLPPFKNPVAVARAVLEDGRHVLYAGEGAARFARAHGFSPSTGEALTTPAARAQWQAGREALAGAGGGHGRTGTVGAVARDALGHVAAATSTGGTVGKRVGRVGDSPIVGAGTYADDEAGAASATGWGEGILRVGLARGAIEAMRSGAHPEAAARAELECFRRRVAGTAGLILVDRDGRLGWARSTASMAWAAEGAAQPLVAAY